MPQLGRLTLSVYREESQHTDELIDAFCQAQAAFLPVSLDKTGYRNGQSYKYASIASIRRSTQTALAMHSLMCHHVYGHNDEGEFVVTVLRHKSGQFISSTLRIPERVDAQEAKAIKTLLCRTAIEGLLGIVTEDDDDGACAVEVDEDQRRQWAMTWSVASMAIANAADVAAVDRYEATAKQRVVEGALSPDMVPEIERVCNERRDQLKKESSSADAKRVAADQEPVVAGGGDGGSHRRNGRGAAVTG